MVSCDNFTWSDIHLQRGLSWFKSIIYKPYKSGSHLLASTCLSFLHCLGAQKPFLPPQPSPSSYLLTSALLQVFAAEKEGHNPPRVTEGDSLPICFSHALMLVEAWPGYKKAFETKTQQHMDGKQLCAAVSSVNGCCDSTGILEYNSPPLKRLPLYFWQISDP